MDISEASFQIIADLLEARTGQHLTESRRWRVNSALAGIFRAHGISNVDQLVCLLAAPPPRGPDSPDLAQEVVEALLNNETYFFRESKHFDFLRQQALAARGRTAMFRVWSAASSSGEEAYSIAMVLADLCASGHVADNWSVVGTDISEKVLRHAVTGIFPLSRLQRVSPQRLKRYCLRGDDEAEGLVKMNAHLTSHVQFGQLNLCEPIDLPGIFDFIFLRNVMIYFDQDTKRQVVDAVLSKLRPGGLFFTGMAEGRLSCQTPLQPLASGVYRKPTHD